MRKLEYSPARYWERRYRDGRTSGQGSEGAEARAKARHVNDVLKRHSITSVVDWGVGDGTVLGQIDTTGLYAYYGLDVSRTILDKVAGEHPAANHHFHLVDDDSGYTALAQLSMSMDVLFHFPDDEDYTNYVARLFNSATSFVLVYSTDYGPERTARHVMRRNFTKDFESLFPEWDLIEKHDDPHRAGFYLYSRSE